MVALINRSNIAVYSNIYSYDVKILLICDERIWGICMWLSGKSIESGYTITGEGSGLGLTESGGRTFCEVCVDMDGN